MCMCMVARLFRNVFSHQNRRLDRLAAALELASQDEPPPPPRRRPRQNDDGAWPAPARSMLPPAKRPRLDHGAMAKSDGGHSKTAAPHVFLHSSMLRIAAATS